MTLYRHSGRGGEVSLPRCQEHDNRSSHGKNFSDEESTSSIATRVRMKMLRMNSHPRTSVRPAAATPGRCWGAAPAVETRQRPRLWSGNPSWSPRAADSEEFRGDKPKRRMDDYDSDDEEDSEDDCEEEQCFQDDFLAKRRSCRQNKKRRKRLSRLDRLDSAVYYNDIFYLNRKTVVTFANTLVTEIWTRPRTLPEDAAKLFYRKADEIRFREEYRREKRTRLLGEWGSDSDESSDDEDTRPIVTGLVGAMTDPPPSTVNVEPASQDPNEVTESDESYDNCACSVESSSSSSGSDSNDDQEGEHSGDEEDRDILQG